MYGVAFDVGSTTLAGHLCDLFSGEVLASAGRMNPQISFGEDLMSRVSYVMMNPGGERELTAVVREALADDDRRAGRRGRRRPGEVLEISLVGNPIMHHLVFGLDPRRSGSAPFALATTESRNGARLDLGLGVHPGARVYSPPCIAGHVGADAAGMVLAEGPHHGDALTLLVDVGTNAEIVLGNAERLLAASSPTGPAFEGAQISSGQRAAPGAIERVRIDRETLEPRIRVIGSEFWSDHPTFSGHPAHGDHWHLRLRDHRGDRRAVPGRCDRCRWHDHGTVLEPGWCRTAAPSPTVVGRPPSSRSPRPTYARSSWPRLRSRQAADC